MAVLGTALTERRENERVAPAATGWQAIAVLRPGQTVVLVNLSIRGALVESGVRLRPNARAELYLAGPGARRRVTGRIDRCQVVRLDPVCYRGAMVFDEGIELGDAPVGIHE